MTVNLIVRVFVDGKMHSETPISKPMEEIERLLPELALEHQHIMQGDKPAMIEIEFVDDPDINERFFRFGTDPRGMKLPLPVSAYEPTRGKA